MSSETDPRPRGELLAELKSLRARLAEEAREHTEALATLLACIHRAEAAEAKIERLTKELKHAIEWKHKQADEIVTLSAALAKARQERDGYRWHLDQCEQIAGRALGYPKYADDQKNFPGATEADGVCIGEHIGDTIVAEMATALARAREALERENVAKALHALDCHDADDEKRKAGRTPPEKWADPWLPTGVRQLERLRARADVLLAALAPEAKPLTGGCPHCGYRHPPDGVCI